MALFQYVPANRCGFLIQPAKARNHAARRETENRPNKRSKPADNDCLRFLWGFRWFRKQSFSKRQTLPCPLCLLIFQIQACCAIGVGFRVRNRGQSKRCGSATCLLDCPGEHFVRFLPPRTHPSTNATNR